MSRINLQTSDGEIFPTSLDVAFQFRIIKTMLEDLGDEITDFVLQP
jgi:hypothetical protein